MFSRRGLAQAPRDMGLSQIAERDGPLSHPMAFTDACALGAFVLGVVFCAAGCVPPRSGTFLSFRLSRRKNVTASR